MRELFYLSDKARGLWLFLVATCVLAVLGPFGTYSELSFLERLIYWGILTFGIGQCMILFVTEVQKRQRAAAERIYPAILIGSALAAIPGTALVFLMYRLMRDNPIGLALLPLLSIWGKVAVIGILVACVELWRVGAQGKDTETLVHRAMPHVYPDATSEPGTPAEERPVFLDRLARSGPQTELISLSMQDHYVEVTSTEGSEMILMRFSDALQELDGSDGLRIHRSHWVARKTIRDMRTIGARNWVVLEDGRELPVSRTYLDEVKQIVASQAKRSG